jgi:putative FmdB family regulatory protein
MPIYEYRCGACGFQKEYLQKMSAAPLTDCPECGKPSFSKMVTSAGFQLKGSGWYATDFKHGAKPKSKPEDSPAAKSEEKSTAKADDKPAAKADAKAAPEAPAKNTDAAASTATSGAGTGPASN